MCDNRPILGFLLVVFKCGLIFTGTMVLYDVLHPPVAEQRES